LITIGFKSIRIGVVALLFMSAFAYAEEATIPLKKVHNDLRDAASLQRGAQLFMNYCQGCHSLQYVRYSQLRDYLGIKLKDDQDRTDSQESIDLSNKAIEENFAFAADTVADPILSAMPRKQSEKWFGVAPPDLSLVTRVRGKDWVYTYLKSFYRDDTKSWGVNNALFPSVAMPHVLVALEGMKNKNQQLETKGELTPQQYDKAVTDLVNFLDYVGEPIKLKRERIGVFVILFLSILTIFLYLLKREYWKDVH
jgi:ubiquinol-cytochrome c reductase cytochrome c1 subunit